MVNGDRHTTVWYWIQARAREISERGIIDANGLQTICNAVTLCDMANDLMSPIDRDQPPPYIFVCAILINVNLLLYSMTKGMIWSTWMNDACFMSLHLSSRSSLMCVPCSITLSALEASMFL